MKPIIIVKGKNEKGNYEFTEKELNDIVEQVYNGGLIDGKAKAQPIYVPQRQSEPRDLYPWQQPWYSGVTQCHSEPNPNIKATN